MNRFSTFIAMLGLAAVAGVSFSPSGAAAQTTAAEPTGDAVHGKANFMKYGCYECHGTLGQGNYFSGPRIAPHPLPFAVISRYIRKPTGQMPSYSTAILPERDLADIRAYLATIPSGKPATAIPLLNGVATKPK
jgi:ubiquinol-cytochrome c reductase cytochrome c subunit